MPRELDLGLLILSPSSTQLSQCTPSLPKYQGSEQGDSGFSGVQGNRLGMVLSTPGGERGGSQEGF